MTLTRCPECGGRISDQAPACPHCGYPVKPPEPVQRFHRWGWQWKSETRVGNWPLIHIALGFNPDTGRPYVARGIIAIGWFAVGMITVAQFGIGAIGVLAQFGIGCFALGQFAGGVLFGAGQFASGYIAVGQIALGYWAYCQSGFAMHLWSQRSADPVAVEYFSQLKEAFLALVK